MLNRRVPFEGFSLSCSGDMLTYSLPWLSIEAELDGPDKETVIAGIEQLKKGDYFALEAQDFLHRIGDYPASYFAPRDALELEPRAGLRDEPLSSATPADILASVGAPYAAHTWLWDVEHIASIARVADGVFDPVTVVTYLIGKRLELEALTDPHRRAVEQKLEKLRVFDEAGLFDVSATMIRQTHYITSRILPILRVAQEAHPALAAPIKHFMDEEIGHDKLMERSLSHLGHADPAAIPVLPSTAAMMGLFELAARRSALAFVSSIGMFEGSSYPESDPLADLLEKTSIPGAAFGYKTHFKINRDQNHKDEILAFAAALPALTRADLALGVRVFELTARASQLVDIELDEAVNRKLSERILGPAPKAPRP